jgi:hypothetical protein
MEASTAGKPKSTRKKNTEMTLKESALDYGLDSNAPRYGVKSRTIAQAVSRRFPTAAAARVQTRIWSCGIL